MITKEQITRKILQSFPKEITMTVDQALQAWWMNFRDGGGMRLTQAGFDTLSASDFETYCFDVPHGFVLSSPRHLLILDKKLDCPYFIKLGKKSQIVLFGSRQAVMLAMYGDLTQWMTFLTRT